MNAVDWMLAGVIAVFAVVGWHRGFLAGVMSFVGFLGGALVGAFVLPPIIGGAVTSEVIRAVVVGIGILTLALVGQLLASLLGARMRSAISWRPVRLVDNLGGAVLNVLALALVSWILASAIAYLPDSPVSAQVSQSRVLATLDVLIPNPARDAFGQLRNLVAASSVPRIFSGFGQVYGPQVAPPDPAAVTVAVRQSGKSVVQVVGRADGCGADVSGSGFVFEPHLVLTNAHVVAGVTSPEVRMSPNRPGMRSTVVYFDPTVDIAILRVRGLDAPPLRLADAEATTGDSAVVAGFPYGGPYLAESVRIRAAMDAHGEDIYGATGVDRRVYGVRGTVAPGNSGGPLLDPAGVVLGLVFGSDAEGGDTGYALTSAALQRVVDGRLPLSGAVATGDCRIRE